MIQLLAGKSSVFKKTVSWNGKKKNHFSLKVSYFVNSYIIILINSTILYWSSSCAHEYNTLWFDIQGLVLRQ